MRPLTITLTPALFALIRSGAKQSVSTPRNPRKDRYFAAKAPDQARINETLYPIIRIEGTPDRWVIHIGKPS